MLVAIMGVAAMVAVPPFLRLEAAAQAVAAAVVAEEGRNPSHLLGSAGSNLQQN